MGMNILKVVLPTHTEYLNLDPSSHFKCLSVLKDGSKATLRWLYAAKDPSVEEIKLETKELVESAIGWIEWVMSDFRQEISPTATPPYIGRDDSELHKALKWFDLNKLSLSRTMGQVAVKNEANKVLAMGPTTDEAILNAYNKGI